MPDQQPPPPLIATLVLASIIGTQAALAIWVLLLGGHAAIAAILCGSFVASVSAAWLMKA